MFGGTFGVAMAIAADRTNGAMDRFRSLPMARGAVLGGHALANLMKALLPMALMSVCGLIVGWRIHTECWHAAAGYGLLVIFAFAMIWIGVLLGSSLATPQAVQGVAFVAIFPHHVHRQHLRPHLDPARRSEDLRRVEPGDLPVRLAADPVRQSRCRRPGRTRPGRSNIPWCTP